MKRWVQFVFLLLAAVTASIDTVAGSLIGCLFTPQDLWVMEQRTMGANTPEVQAYNQLAQIVHEHVGSPLAGLGVYDSGSANAQWGRELGEMALFVGVLEGARSQIHWQPGRAGGARGLSTPTSFTEADVQAAIRRLQSRGINPSEFQSHIDPQHVINLAERMRSGTFDPARMDQPVIFETTSQSVLSGHHRVIAAEMADFYLPQTPIAVPGTKPGDWSKIPLIPRRRQ